MAFVPLDNSAPIPQQPIPAEEIPWYMKYGGRALGTFGGIGKSDININDKSQS